MNDHMAVGATAKPMVFALIPERDFLVVFDDGEVPLPDAEVLEELEIQADQRCAPETLSGVPDALLTVAEAVAGNVLTSMIAASYPSLGRYVERVKTALRRPRNRQTVPGTSDPDPAPVPATAPDITQRTRAALQTTVGEPTVEPALTSDPATQALRATVEVSGKATVEVRAERSGRLICITVVEKD